MESSKSNAAMSDKGACYPEAFVDGLGPSRPRRGRRRVIAIALAGLTALNQTSSPFAQPATNNAGAVSLEQQTRAACIQGRRYIAGRVERITSEGLVVDSGYDGLLQPPFSASWVLPATVVPKRNPNAIENKDPDALCIGLVFLFDYPKRPAVKTGEYVVIHGYPAGRYEYSPAPSIHKTLRKFSGGLEKAIKTTIESRGK